MFFMSLYNSLRFARRDSLPPNFDNTLHLERYQAGLGIVPYKQPIEIGDTSISEPLKIQIRTIYANVTARIVDSSGISTPITVTKKATKPTYSSWEFEYVFNVQDCFVIYVNGTDPVLDDVEYISEPIDVAEEHKDTIRIDAFNTTNTEFVDYSTGIRHFLRVPARFPDAEDEADENIYDDQNKKTKTYSATTFNVELVTGGIPEYLVRQIRLMQGLYFFYLNGKRHTGTEFSSERFGASTLKQLTLVCAEFDTPGVNSDDSGILPPTPEIPPEEMENITFFNLENVTGQQQFNVDAGYMVDAFVCKLKTGTSITIKAGFASGGDDILSPKTLTSADSTKTYDREIAGGASQYENPYVVYIDLTGVGATADVNMIIKKYK